MRTYLSAGLAVVALCAATPRPAEAWGGGGVVLGTAVGLGVGAIIGTTIARPYPYPYYPYPYYPYGYYPSAYAYPPPYPYAYPPTVAYPPPNPLPPMPQPQGRPASYAAPASVSPTPAQTCRAGQFFNTLTGSCDRR